MATLFHIASILGALITIIGFLTLVSEPFRTWFKSCIKKTIKDDEQDIMIKSMANDVKSMHQSIDFIIQQLKLQNESDLTLMRNNITLAYYKYRKKGEIPVYVREGLIKQYEQYGIAGGNSYIGTIFPEILKIPVENQ